MDREEADQRLREKVESKMVPVYMSSYDQLKDYYQDKAGHRNWIGAMAQAITGSDNRSKSNKPYLAARRSIERHEKGQYQGFRGYREKMREVGRSLPPVGRAFPGNQVTITIKAHQNKDFVAGKAAGTRDRTWSATFSGVRAYDFASDPTFRDIWEALDYPDDVVDRLDYDGDYVAEIYSIA